MSKNSAAATVSCLARICFLRGRILVGGAAACLNRRVTLINKHPNRQGDIMVTKSGDDMFLCRRCTAPDDSCVSGRSILARRLCPSRTIRDSET